MRPLGPGRLNSYYGLLLAIKEQLVNLNAFLNNCNGCEKVKRELEVVGDTLMPLL